MKLTLSQCKADNESAALRGLRRSLRSSYCSSSSSSSSRSIQPNQEALPSLQCTPIYSVVTSASASVKPQKQRRIKLARKREEIVLFTLEEESSTFDKSKASIRRQRSLDLSLTRRSNLPKTLCRTSSCTTIGRKRVIGFDDHEYNSTSCFSSDLDEEEEESPRKRFASPKTPSSCLDRSPPASSSNLSWWSANPLTPSTPSSLLDFSNEKQCIGGDSLLENLPFDLLLHIVCCLEHDNLKPVSQVCKRLFQAVSTAWQNHFCFTTPRRDKKGLKFELFPEEPRAEAAAHGNQAVGMFIRPPTPQAPRQPPRPTEERLNELCETCPFAPSASSLSATSISADAERMKPLSLSSHRVLFSEDELCQAVAENTLS